MPFIFSISLSLDKELDRSTEFFGSPIPAQRCYGCVSNAARKHSNNKKVNFQIFPLPLLVRSFQGQSNKTQACHCKFSALTSNRALQRRHLMEHKHTLFQFHSHSKAECLRVATLDPKTKTWLLDLVLPINKCLTPQIITCPFLVLHRTSKK